MKNQEQKEYEAPQTTCLEVELEQGFMSGSTEPGDPIEETGGVTIGEQSPGVAIGGSGDGWDNSGTWDNKWD